MHGALGVMAVYRQVAGLIYNWISMGPSNRRGDRHSVELFNRAKGAEKILALASSPPSAKSVMLGGGSDPPSTKSVMLGGRGV